MAGSTNFLQWNPGQNNQETDSQYAADSQRSGGAPNSTPFPSITANKLFYQLSTGLAALMQMMAAKGFEVNDTNIGTLASVLAAIQTTADIKKSIQSVAYSSSVSLDASQYNGFQISLTGNLSFSITGAAPGQIIALIFQNDVSGNHTVTFPNNWLGKFQPDPSANSISVIMAIADSTGTNFRAIGPMTSANGISNTPIGQTLASPGSFTTLSASSDSTLNGGTLNGAYAGNPSFSGVPTSSSPPATDNTSRIATTSWVQNLFSAMGFSFNTNASKGHFKLPSFLGGFIIQWGTVPMPGSSSSNNPTPFSFDINFPTAVLTCVPATFGGTDRITFIESYSQSGGTMSNNGSGVQANYIAFGY